MACPTKRHGSDNWYFRRQIPADVRVILGKLPKAQRPRNWYRTHINISLRTADRGAAKAKCPEIAAEVEKQIAALREGPKPLSPKQIAALSGELYKAATVGLEDDPVVSSGMWQRVAAENEAARRGEHGNVAKLGIHKTQEDRRRVSMEARFGKMTDVLLSHQAIVTDPESRWKLIERVSLDLSEAAKKLARNADGDFSADEYLKRLPKLERSKKNEAHPHSLKALFAAWHAAALARDVRKRDAKRIKQRTEKFIEFLGHDDPTLVTKADINRWADKRTAEGVTEKTINNSDLASLKNIFNWAVDREWMEANPAHKLRYRGRKKKKVRERYFTTAEIIAILKAAAAASHSGRELVKTTAAKRWVPWLCAYSGSRVSEMVQIRKEDLRMEGKGWVLRLTPEAGGIKTDEYRDVPIHEHLVAEGFIDFVRASRDGPLFCNIGNDGTIEGPAAGIYNRIRTFIRAVVPDPNIAPNHAWRHTFKTLGIEADIQEINLDAICGHGARHEGRKYSHVTLKARAEAMGKFPRYL
jgi:integrase